MYKSQKNTSTVIIKENEEHAFCLKVNNNMYNCVGLDPENLCVMAYANMRYLSGIVNTTWCYKMF